MYLVEGQFTFGTGAIRDSFDHRDRVFGAGAPEAPAVDWAKGYDVRDELVGDVVKKNQFSSLSCVGQGWSYYVWVLNILELMKKYGMNLTELRQHHAVEVEMVSAKSIYSQIHLDGGGASIRDGAKLIKKWGSLFENQVPSLKSDGMTDELFMADVSWLNDTLNHLAEVLKAKEYRTITPFGGSLVDLFAAGVKQNHGVVGGVVGTNNGTWLSQFPKPPKQDDVLWGHCLYYGAFGTDERGRFLATPNSWGDFITEKWQPGSTPGTGWQKLYIDYFSSDLQFNPWTLIDQPNNSIILPEDMKKLVKGDIGSDVFCVDVVGVLHHILNPHTFVAGRDAKEWGDWNMIETKPQAEVDALPKGDEVLFTPNK